MLFAVVHVYWAAGGAAGMNGEPADTLAAQLYIAFTAISGWRGARRLRARPRPAPALTLLDLDGGAALLLARRRQRPRLAQWSLEGDGAAGVVTTLLLPLRRTSCS